MESEEGVWESVFIELIEKSNQCNVSFEDYASKEVWNIAQFKANFAVKKVDEYEYLWHQNLEVWLCAAHKNLAALVAINCINGLLSFFSFFVLYTIRKCVNCQYSMFNKSFDVTIPTKLDKGDEKKKK